MKFTLDKRSLHNREFKRVCVNSSIDAFNSAAFKRIGYSLNIGCAYNDTYSSVMNYFDAEVFSVDIVDLNVLDRRLVNLSVFNSAVYKKKMDLEYIEVAPKILPVTKIAEKMKAYGLWEKFVTDSFDEYIDNLVIGTGAELDEDDLFQEEFF